MAKSLSKKNSSKFIYKLKNVLSVNRQSELIIFDECWWDVSFTGFKYFLIFYLTNKNNSVKEIKPYQLRCFIEDRHKNPVQVFEHYLDTPDLKNTVIWMMSRQELQKKRDEYLTDGALNFIIVFLSSITRNVEIYEKVSDKSVQTSDCYRDKVTCLQNLSFDLKNLLDHEIHSDVTVEYEKGSFRAHKSILSARSEVFSAMFRSDMIESRTGIIEMTDMDTAALHQFFMYIYSGRIVDLSMDTAPKLYEAADKYAIESLKKLCAKFMTKNLAKENACKILVLADTHGDNDLKDCVISFITDMQVFRIKYIWLEFVNEHPKLATEVLNHTYEALMSIQTDSGKPNSRK